MNKIVFRLEGTIDIPIEDNSPVDFEKASSYVKSVADLWLYDKLYCSNVDITVTVVDEADADLHPVRLTKSQVGVIRHIFLEVSGCDAFSEEVAEISDAIRDAEKET